MCTQGNPNLFECDLAEVNPYLKAMDDELRSYLCDTCNYDFTQFDDGTLGRYLKASSTDRQVVVVPFNTYLFMSSWSTWTLTNYFPKLRTAIKDCRKTLRDKTVIHKAYVCYRPDGLRMFWNRRTFEIVVELSHT